MGEESHADRTASSIILKKLPVTCEKSSAPGRIRTCGLLLRRQTLYPLSYGGAPTKCCADGPRQTNASVAAATAMDSGRHFSQ